MMIRNTMFAAKGFYYAFMARFIGGFYFRALKPKLSGC